MKLHNSSLIILIPYSVVEIFLCKMEGNAQFDINFF